MPLDGSLLVVVGDDDPDDADDDDDYHYFDDFDDGDKYVDGGPGDRENWNRVVS